MTAAKNPVEQAAVRVMAWLDATTDHECRLRKHEDGYEVVLIDTSGVVGSASGEFSIAVHAAVDMACSELPGVLRLRAARIRERARRAGHDERRYENKATQLIEQAQQIERQQAVGAIAGQGGGAK